MKLLARSSFVYKCRRWNSIVRAVVPESELKPVIGLEIHAQLMVKSKIFSDSPVMTNAASNTNVSLFDLGTPGTLPTLNRRCVELAIRTGLLLNCEVAKECRFDRKHYFYPDMPMGYQITQHELPIARNGYMDYVIKDADGLDREVTDDNRRRVRIKQIQMEMDSGKIVYGMDRNLIDLNRAGIGLVEIVTEPDLHTPVEVAFFVQHLRLMLLHNQICLGEMHNGQLRVDANVSISVNGKMGTRTETKNINTFHDVKQCVEFEIKRQIALINRGGQVEAETRSAVDGKTIRMRAKSAETDYRFLPEPNLPRLRIKDEMVEHERQQVKLDAPHMEYIFKHKLPVNFTFQAITDPKFMVFVDKCLELLKSSPSEVVALLNELSIVFKKTRAVYPPESHYIMNACYTLMDLLLKRRITHLAYLDLVRFYVEQAESAEQVGVETKITELDFWAILEETEILKIVDETFADAEPKLIEKARNTPQSKHFNKLRDLVVNRVNKRIHIEDAKKYVMQKLQN